MSRFTFLLAIAIPFSQFANAQCFFNGNAFEDEPLWSTSANWADEMIPTANDVAQFHYDGPVWVDSDVTVLQLKSDGLLVLKSKNNSKVTIDNNSPSNAAVLINQMLDPDVLLFDCHIEINNSQPGISYIQNNGDYKTIEFTENSILELTREDRKVQFTSQYNTCKSLINGAIIGASNITIGSNAVIELGSTADLSRYTGNFVQQLASEIHVRMDGVFIKSGGKLQNNGDQAKLFLYSKDTFQGKLSMGGRNTYTVEFYEDQLMMDTIVMIGANTLNLNIKPGVKVALEKQYAEEYSSTSEVKWNSAAKINIQGYQPKCIRFGTDNQGLSPKQLSQIFVPGIESLALDKDGYLVDAEAASVNQEKFSLNNLLISVIDDGMLRFKLPVKEVTLVNINGQVIDEQSNINSDNYDISSLSNGVYLVRYDGQITKFIKK